MKILLVAGHGPGYLSNDPGAVGNGTNERDFIRKYIVPNVAKYLKEAGHKVFLYGGTKMAQDLYQDTAYGMKVGDYKKYGMYWVSHQGYDTVIEFHLDAAGVSASGGHVIIGSGLTADNIDKRLHQAIKKNVGTIRGITGRGNLANVNVAKDYGVNYRLVELGFITSKKDMDVIKKNYMAYCKDIAEAIHGKSIGKPKTQPKEKHKVVEKKNEKVTKIPTSIRTKKGDTLIAINKKYGVPIFDIISFNPKISSALIPEGTFLYLKKPTEKKVEVKKSSTKKVVTVPDTYKVKKGDTLTKIAKKYKIKVADIISINGLVTDKIFIDQVLKLKGKKIVTAKKLKAPSKEVKVEEVMQYVESLAKSKTSVDMDNAYNSQCMDLTIAVAFKFFKWWPSGDAIKLSTQAIPTGWKRIKNTPSFVPKRGDILIWNNGTYGHTAIATGKGDTNWFQSVDQNWTGNGNGLVPAQYVNHDYTNFWGVLRPPYAL